ncbi:hypothetical protein JX265_001949 [Neoarthrinium moseri]|uniref:Major facilitator superfamily (MFS) profile domain-containing protein n=1 Tax=Neoarthrinium moseri TaxID=1658444 RepID=A0A9P9WW53_9PEZI|nr:hypothetical protein JX265_001949 [Neoarthrinium moseri]
MALLYLFAHIDRGNIGNAKIEGMDKDLGLVGNQYNIASTIFFVPYIIFEIPSNIVIKKIRPSIWLSALMLAWGVVMTCMGVVQNFSGLAACRVLLGVFEAGFFPGAAFLVGQWYPRHELQQRLALFYTASALSGALSGLLAFAIARMDGLRGIEGWRWIFIVEGAVTVFLGLAMPLLISDSLERVGWLSDTEKRVLDLRLRLSGVRTNSEESDKFSWKLLLQTMTDWKIALGILIAFANSVPNAAFKFTMPQIIQQFGFSTQTAQLLTIPPYFLGAVSAWLNGRLSDKFAWRMPFIAGPLTVLCVAFAILFTLSVNVRQNMPGMYFGVMLAQIGIYPLLPGTIAWVGNNLAPSWKRSIGLAWLLAAGNVGSIIGTSIFLDKEGPRYPTGYGVSLGIICMGLVSAIVMELALMRLNKVKARISEASVRQAHTQAELDAMGEKSPLYQYIL